MIFDEIDLVPNDILMRIKHLFTKKPWSKYFPQEDWDTEVELKTTGMIATANIKWEKHQDREDLDPAIVRLFEVINVSQIPEDEMVDMVKATLVNENGFITREDRDLILKRIEDISEEDFEKNVLDAEIEFFTNWNSFVDPYELANIDPYKVRNLEKLEFWDKTSKVKNVLQWILADLATKTGDEFENLQDKIGDLLENLEKKEVKIEDWEEIVAELTELDLNDEVERLGKSGIEELGDLVKRVMILKLDLKTEIKEIP